MKTKMASTTTTTLVMMFTSSLGPWRAPRHVVQAFGTSVRRAAIGSIWSQSGFVGNKEDRRDTRRFFATEAPASPKTTTDENEVVDTSSPLSSSSIYVQQATELAGIRSKFLKTLRDRGFLHQCTNLVALDELLAGDSDSGSAPVAAYLGFDATADSLHVGSLLQIMVLRHYQNCGHKPVVLIGGGTSRVGDPTGKDESRKLLDDDTIARNTAGIKGVFSKFLRFADDDDDATTDAAIMVDNYDWLGNINYLDFLRDYGSQFTINRMMSFESVKQRLEREAPFSFLEFNYMILQAYDFLELYRRYDVRLQLGGSDQWGNIVSGTELGRRCEKDGAQLFGLTAPLVTTSDGRKMGKTEGGAIWLNADKLSPYDYWQFWRNTADDDTVRFLKLFTELPLEEIDALAQLEGAEINRAKLVLADEATKLLHGEECLTAIRETAASMFSSSNENKQSTESLPRVYVTTESLSEGSGPRIDEILIELGFSTSKKDARRLVDGGGARLNDVKIENANTALQASDFSDDIPREATIRAGKKRAGVVELVDSIPQ